MKSLDIGFIGLGVMGSPMAGHLARAGHSLTLLDANPSAAKQLAQALGGPVRAVRTPREVAEASDIVITMLPNGHAVQTVALGEDGLVHGLRRDAALLDTSSSEPWLTQQTAKTVAERGATMVDAAVSGAEAGAKGAELVFMVGGSDQDVARVRPLLEVMGRSVFHLGPLGSGHAMKCINNCIRHDHRGDRRRPGRRQALRPGSDEDDRRAQPVHRRLMGHSHAVSIRVQPPVRRFVQAGVDAQGHRHRRRPGGRHFYARPMWDLGQQLWRMADHAAGPGASISEVVRWIEKQAGTELTPGRSVADPER